jgi:CubicO group peptidase (beta-lactamase class C family)
LLNHTSGIADYESAFTVDWDKSNIVENKDILDWLATNPDPVFEPGEKWEYSNTAYLVLALLVEKLSGQDFAQFAKENVFHKSGMKNTNFYSLAHPIEIPERAYCYEKDSTGIWQKRDGFYMNGVLGDGALYTSLNDYFKYDVALRNASILSKEMHDVIFKPSALSVPGIYDYSFINGAQLNYAMGWFRTPDLALHTGSWIGTRTIVVREFERPLTIALFLNSNATYRETIIDQVYTLVNGYLKTQ